MQFALKIPATRPTLNIARTSLLLCLLFLTACERPLTATNPLSQSDNSSNPRLEATPTLARTQLSVNSDQLSPDSEHQATSTSADPVMPATALGTATPFYTGVVPAPCGQILPILPAVPAQLTESITPDEETLAALDAIIPASARPALSRILTAPETVGLAAYRLNDPQNGVYLNADAPMPLASVVKLIHLVAYAEAVAAGELDPLETIELAAIDDFYLPFSDLGTHRAAVAELEETERLFGSPPNLLLDEVPWMMIRHSDNAATDYLHMRLGQKRVEETAVSLNLTSQTAPCPFLGQFLIMSSHTRTIINDRGAIQTYADNPETYGQDVMLLTAAYNQLETFREIEVKWRTGTRRPHLNAQELFSETLNAHGTAREYASLMGRLAQNGLTNADSSYTVRRTLEWPMQFEANQLLFNNLGYKNGQLPGILTTVYYAYPLDNSAPIVVTLFYRDLPIRTYQRWRNQLPHDEFARWLLSDPAAIPALQAVLSP